METHTLPIKKKRETEKEMRLFGKRVKLGSSAYKIKAGMTLGNMFNLSFSSVEMGCKTFLAGVVVRIKWTSVYKVPSRVAWHAASTQ